MSIAQKCIYLESDYCLSVHLCCWLIKLLWDLQNLKNNSVYSGKNIFKELKLSSALIWRSYFGGPNTQLSTQSGLKLETWYSSADYCWKGKFILEPDSIVSAPIFMWIPKKFETIVYVKF